jgi:hypothetical protein
MVEAISSLGYIVVLPDYPGFRSQADTTPYLVARQTVRSITDMLYVLMNSEMRTGMLNKNEYYLMDIHRRMGNSFIHKEIEQNLPVTLILWEAFAGRSL